MVLCNKQNFTMEMYSENDDSTDAVLQLKHTLKVLFDCITLSHTWPRAMNCIAVRPDSCAVRP